MEQIEALRSGTTTDHLTPEAVRPNISEAETYPALLKARRGTLIKLAESIRMAMSEMFNLIHG